MSKKEMYKLVAYEYMKQYWTECGIYNALKPFNVYVNIEGPLKEAYLEKILHSLGDFFVETLLDCQNYEEVDELLEEYLEGMED